FVQGAADMKLERIMSELGCCNKIFANSAKQLAPDFFINREHGIECEFAAQRNGTSGGKAQIRRTQEQLIDQEGITSEMILCFGWFEVELRQFLDLQQLSERSEHCELLHMAILQKDGAGTAQRIRIGGVAGRLEGPFESTWH